MSYQCVGTSFLETVIVFKFLDTYFRELPGRNV